MTDSASNRHSQNKFSDEFARRLSMLEPGQHIPAAILLVIPPLPDAYESQTRTERRAASERAISQATERASNAIDDQLSMTGGRRLSQKLNRIGFVIVEASAATFCDLASQPWVKAIVEDHAICIDSDS